MSILTEQHNDPVTHAKRAATQVKRGIQQTAKGLIHNWEHAFDLVWHNRQATPAEVFAELGTDAGEALALSAALVAFLETVLTGRDDEQLAKIQAKVSALPAFTVAENGSVTLD